MLLTSGISLAQYQGGPSRPPTAVRRPLPPPHRMPKTAMPTQPRPTSDPLGRGEERPAPGQNISIAGNIVVIGVIADYAEPEKSVALIRFNGRVIAVKPGMILEDKTLIVSVDAEAVSVAKWGKTEAVPVRAVW